MKLGGAVIFDRPKRSTTKFRNRPTHIDGIKFDSRKEAQWYLALRDRLNKGDITNLRVHQTYKLMVNGVTITSFRPDFVYEQNGKTHVVDVKGYFDKKSPAARLFVVKARLLEALYGLQVEIV